VELFLQHNFSVPMRVVGVTSSDGRFLVIPAAPATSVVSVHSTSPLHIATIRFDPSRLFDARQNYMSGQLHSKGSGASDFWLDEDLLLLQQREAAWKLLAPDPSGTGVVTAQLHVQTDVLQRASAEVRGQLVWPQVVRPVLYFGAVPIGMTERLALVVTNPSRLALDVIIFAGLAPTQPGRVFDLDAKAHPPDFSVSNLVRISVHCKHSLTVV
jgi:hypothetical protein